MLQLVLFVLFRFAFSGSGDLFVSIGLGTASIKGFSWSYDIKNPDLTDPKGKIYWVLTDDGVEMSIDDILAGNNPTGGQNCFGSKDQEDDTIHEERMDCTLVAGTNYLFWVAADYNGDGTLAFDATFGGQLIVPEVDADCGGFWGTCDSDCYQYYTITQYPSGDGAACEIGDEEEQLCVPGTDDCPLQGTYYPHDGDTSGFDLDLQGDPAADQVNGLWYWMVLPVGGAPTAAEIQSGVGGLCTPPHTLPLSTTTTHIDCVLSPGTYDVWVDEDPSGDGNPTVIMPVRQIVIPEPLPTVSMGVTNPSSTGFVITEDVDNANPSGTFYWMVSDSPATLTADQIRAHDPSLCWGTQSTSDGTVQTISADCPALTAGTTYYLWGEVDSDSSGGDASIANDGASVPFTVPAGPSVSMGVTNPSSSGFTITENVDNPNSSGTFYWMVSDSPDALTAEQIRAHDPSVCWGTQSTSNADEQTISAACPALTEGTTYYLWGEVDSDSNGADASIANGGQSVVFTVAAGGGDAQFRLMFAGEECETDEIGDFAWTWNTMLLPNVFDTTTYQSNVQKCANQVQASRNANQGCSTLFHSGGPTGECKCVRLGYVCDREDSEDYYRSIYKLCLNQQSCSQMIPIEPDVLRKTRPQANSSPLNFFGVPVIYLLLALLTGLVVGIGSHYLFARKERLDDFYHISLDDARSI